MKRQGDNDWHLRAYYGRGAESHKPFGGFAIQTWAASDDVRDMEMRAFRSRPDIGRVDVWGGPDNKPVQSFDLDAEREPRND